MPNYVVEKQENGIWVPKFRCNFEDEHFSKIAQNVTVRILCDGIDITAKYRNGYIPQSVNNAVNNISETFASPMKPAQYKALSEEEKKKLQEKATSLKEAKTKRSDIFLQMNITEATYDAIRADMDKPASNEPSPEPQPVLRGTAPASIRRAGLLGRR